MKTYIVLQSTEFIASQYVMAAAAILFMCIIIHMKPMIMTLTNLPVPTVLISDF